MTATRGPWKYVPENYHSVNGPDGTVVAFVQREVEVGLTAEVQADNARLIALAPELLEALKHLKQMHEHDPDWMPEWDALIERYVERQGRK